MFRRFNVLILFKSDLLAFLIKILYIVGLTFWFILIYSYYENDIGTYRFFRLCLECPEGSLRYGQKAESQDMAGSFK